MSDLIDQSIVYRRERQGHWDRVAKTNSKRNWFQRSYHELIRHCIRLNVPAGMQVLELGCGDGGLLSALQPKRGVGIDFSRTMLQKARENHPELHLVLADAHYPSLSGTFDYIILSDLVNDLWDVQQAFEHLAHLTHSRTRIIINSYSRLWQIPLTLAGHLNMKTTTLQQNWLTIEDLENLLGLSNAEIVKEDQVILLPAVGIPLVSKFANKILVKLWPFNLFALTNLVVARPLTLRPTHQGEASLSVSVIIPARNEEGNIEAIFRRTPQLGSEMELIFVEGHSRDATYEKIAEEIKKHPNRKAFLHKQEGTGKADAVKQGFAVAKGDILMILDSDLSVSPEELTRFYKAIASGNAEFVNGVRLVYPMEARAMQYLNLIGNKIFGLIFSWLLGQEIKDTLCGTKVIRRRDYKLLTRHWSELGRGDPFGDFDLLFGAAKLGLKIVDMPIRYNERTYGSTNISRWRHGLMLLRMVMLAARRLKFV